MARGFAAQRAHLTPVESRPPVNQIRSRAAAEFLAERGYTTYNVTDGFEGPINDYGHRGASGWRAEQLPWKQS